MIDLACLSRRRLLVVELERPVRGGVEHLGEQVGHRRPRAGEGEAEGREGVGLAQVGRLVRRVGGAHDELRRLPR